MRLQALEDLIASTDRKVIVFAPFKHTLHGIHKHLIAEGYDVAPPIDGDVPQHQRNTIFGMFQNTANYRIPPAHPGTMAHGLMLTSADTIYLVRLDFVERDVWSRPTPRIRLVGQRHRQQILMLQATSPPSAGFYHPAEQAGPGAGQAFLELFEENLATEVNRGGRS